MPSKIEWLAFAAVLLISGSVILLYGETKYNAGVSDTEKKQAQANATAQDDGRKTMEQSQAKARSLPDTDLDNALRDIGMLRQ